MSTNRFNDDEFDRFESRFNPLNSDRKARRMRKPRANPRDKKLPVQPVLEDRSVEEAALDGIIQTTYTPARFEAGYLMDSVREFFDQTLITDILALVKGGKEASVYRCVANPTTGYDLLAAKVYRPRQFRNLRNDVMYREGREYLSSEGGSLNEGDLREMRAIRNKTGYGVQLQHQSWLNYEYSTLEMLHKSGASVPRPIAVAENAILMEYIGDESVAAPALSQVRLDRDEAHDLFEDVLRNIRIMLDAGWIHGDLSAYNILYWDGAVTLIDFPQVTNVHANRSAKFILSRDIQRVCEYFIKQGVRCDTNAITDRLWRGYIDRYPNERAADQSRLEPEDFDT